MKKIILGAVCASLLTINANADFLGAEAGYALWTPALTGTIKNGSDLVDMEKDLGFGEKENNSFIWAYIDHPIPFLPNVKIQQTNYTDKSKGALSKNLTFANKAFAVSEKTTNEFTLNQTDIILYWRLLDNWVNLDIGLEAKSIEGNIKINNETKHIDEDFSITLPLAYAKARFDLPFSGFSVEADIATASFDGNSFIKLFKTSAIKSIPIRSYNPNTPVFGIPIGLPKTASASSIDSFILKASVIAICIA